MTRRDIEFSAEGTTLRGWFYTADDSVGARPTIVMAHGYSAVKEMYLDRYAEVFAAAGLNALVFDNRNFGASHGSIPARRSIRGSRFATTGTPSPSPPPWPRSTPTTSVVGQQLFRRPHARRVRARPPRQGRGEPGGPGRRLPEPASFGAPGLHRGFP
ncbi:possible hydrolase (plasmid) [Rhodococcus jostii RHA1]|uniref:Possible hydrolase n=1 Tax=Rhodococcus jostii (strain RHA1) TaxID=101510 RepID=Q0RWG3_RHOJR|nr:possible hydrolase [Rhodococcus jostii RHA1]